MAKINRVIQIKLNQLVQENVHMISDLPTKRRLFKRYHGDKHFSQFLRTRWRQKSTGMEQNYVAVTLRRPMRSVKCGLLLRS